MSKQAIAIPKLRFPEFQNAGDWEEKKLSDLGNTFNGLIGKTKIDFGKGKPYIQYMQIFSNSKINIHNFGLVNIKDNESQNKAQYGDIFFTTSSETPDETGMSSVFMEKTNDNDVYLNSFCFGYRPNSLNELVPAFSQFFFRSDKIRTEIKKLAQGVTRFNMSKSKFIELKFNIPKEKEQQKIADCLSSLDALITTQTKKLTALQTHKKGLMQNLFPAEDKTTPKLRFPEFQNSSEWGEGSLGEKKMVTITIGEFVIKTKQHPNSQYPVYNGGKSYTGFYDEFNNEGNKIVVSSRGANAGYINIVKNRYWAGNSCYSVGLMNEKYFNIYFLYFYMKANENRFRDNQQVANIPSVSKSDVQNFKVTYPKPKEQQKIADCLSSLDNLITTQTKKLTALQQHKKGLMQNLFPPI